MSIGKTYSRSLQKQFGLILEYQKQIRQLIALYRTRNHENSQHDGKPSRKRNAKSKTEPAESNYPSKLGKSSSKLYLYRVRPHGLSKFYTQVDMIIQEMMRENYLPLLRRGILNSKKLHHYRIIAQPEIYEPGLKWTTPAVIYTHGNPEDHYVSNTKNLEYVLDESPSKKYLIRNKINGRSCTQEIAGSSKYLLSYYPLKDYRVEKYSKYLPAFGEIYGHMKHFRTHNKSVKSLNIKALTYQLGKQS